MQHLFQKITLNYIIHKWHVLILWQIKAQKQFYIKEISIKNFMSNNSETRTYFIPIKYRTKIFIKVYINIYNYCLIFLITLVMIGKMDSKMLQ